MNAHVFSLGLCALLALPALADAQELTRTLQGSQPGEYLWTQVSLDTGATRVSFRDEFGDYAGRVTLTQAQLDLLRAQSASLPAPGAIPAWYPVNFDHTRLSLVSGGVSKTWTYTPGPRDEAAAKIEGVLESVSRSFLLGAAFTRPFQGQANVRLLSGQVEISGASVKLRTYADPDLVTIRMSSTDRYRLRGLHANYARLVVKTTSTPDVYEFSSVLDSTTYKADLATRIDWSAGTPRVEVPVHDRVFRRTYPERSGTGLATRLLVALARRGQRPASLRVDGVVNSVDDRFETSAVHAQLAQSDGTLADVRVLFLRGDVVWVQVPSARARVVSVGSLRFSGPLSSPVAAPRAKASGIVGQVAPR